MCARWLSHTYTYRQQQQKLQSIWLAVVAQHYLSEAENEYVIRGNAAVMKCKIPSFVADFVHVEAWINAEDGTVLTAPNNDSSASYGYFSLYFPHSHFFSSSVTATFLSVLSQT